MSPQRHVVVLGAGVTGLTTANFLAEAGHLVTVIAAHVPGDKSINYTSPWAGAHWSTFATTAQPMLCDWDMQSYHYWTDLLASERKDASLPKSGIKMLPSYHLWHDAPPQGNLWWCPLVTDFSILPTNNALARNLRSRAPPGENAFHSAAGWQTPCINSPHYLLYLQAKGRRLGVEVIKASLPTDSGLGHALTAAEDLVRDRAGRPVDVFVNATGLGAGKLCGDPTVFPIRGQTVLVRGEADKTISYSGPGGRWSAYVIPRPGSGMTILGGTREEGIWSEKPDDATTEQILTRCGYLVPELMTGRDGGFEVVSVQCGLRPGRKGGPRMETEVVVDGRNQERKVVHAYGHAGAGYQNSVGSARVTRNMVEKCLGTTTTTEKARL